VKIKNKILCTLFAMSLLVALVGVLAVNCQRASVTTAATKEAENVANVLGFIFLSDSNQLHSSTQEIIRRLHEAQGRDVVLVDARQAILADAVPSEVGKNYAEGPNDEIGSTIKDGKIRTFVETSSDSLVGMKQIVVPIKSKSGQTLGAVVLEYTPLYNELMQLTKNTTRQITLAAFGSVIIAFLIAFFTGRSVARPLQQLTDVMTEFASGKTDLPLPPPRKDEIGELANAFNNMVQKRKQVEEELRYARNNMETRIEERTRELAESQSLYYSLVDQMPAGVFRKDAEGRFVFVNASYCKIKCLKPDQILGKTPRELAASEFANPNTKHPEAAKEIELAIQGANNHEWIMKTGKPIEVEELYPGADGKTQHWQVVKSPVFGPDEKIIGTQGMFFDVTERKRAEAELSYERDLLRALLDYSPDPIYFKDAQSHFLKAGKALAELLGVEDTDELVGKTDFDFFTEEHARPAFKDEQEIIRTGRPLIGKVEKEVLKDGRETWALTNKMPFRNKDGQIIGTFGISKDITVTKETEAKLEQVHKQLLEASRRAGMAEIATNVLHNVGNVLNSVNVSASMVADSVKKSKASSLAKVVMMLREHEHDLGTFITSNVKGKQLPAYLAQLSELLLADQKTTVKELELLLKNIEHIKEIVTMQQNYARVSGIKEIINIRELVEDGLHMNLGALERHGVEIIREFEEVPLINIDKHKVLQILVNLIRNSKHACQDSERADKRLTVRVTNGDGQIRISVADNGVGISPENMTRIFNHGFTTRKDGHGFGLHSGALAAKEMGGSLTVHSDGPGQGATFTLELPCATNESPNE
jgi:PAS domain S-box-containing protein